MADLRRLLPLVLVGLAGAGLAVLLFPDAPEPAPTPAREAATTAQPPAEPPPATRLPGQRPPPTPRSSNDLDQRPRLPEPPPPTPEELAAWQAEAPVALHAQRDAGRWHALADLLPDQGLPELAEPARSIAMRLERALSPRPDDEVHALLVEEIELLRTIGRAGVDEQTLAMVQSIEQGAHHAIQGAPTPEMLEAERRAREPAGE